jgi:chitinase
VNTIFRAGVSSANAQTFANNILAFLNKYNLDGIDIDWEYPVGTDGFWFTIFLSTLRQTLGANKVISIAASASYGNLKGMPIQTMSNYVDYIVFMTYDLHGQWDYGTDVDPGCSTPGACLRSHVNWTETSYALGMITKSGVNANQVVVGVTSYGRSFQMAQAGCTGPQCLYTGPSSGALAGRCTQTQGYLADAEIYEILATNPSASTSIDDNISQSDVIVYNQTQWAAYMSKTTKAARTNRYQGLKFGGVANWAVDLEDFHATPSATAQVSGGRFKNATARAL